MDGPLVKLQKFSVLPWSQNSKSSRFIQSVYSTWDIKLCIEVQKWAGKYVQLILFYTLFFIGCSLWAFVVDIATSQSHRYKFYGELFLLL